MFLSPVPGIGDSSVAFAIILAIFFILVFFL
jgi:hypothetical protein